MLLLDHARTRHAVRRRDLRERGVVEVGAPERAVPLDGHPAIARCEIATFRYRVLRQQWEGQQFPAR